MSLAKLGNLPFLRVILQARNEAGEGELVRGWGWRREEEVEEQEEEELINVFVVEWGLVGDCVCVSG